MNTKYNNSIVFTMRIKPELHKVLKELAKNEKRSIAKQIEYMLEKAIKENAKKNKRSISKEIEYELEQINKK